jgi:hypothetical protein
MDKAPADVLQELIRQKEAQQKLEEAIVKAQFALTYERMKPINLLRNTIQQASESPEIKAGLPAALLNVVSGFLLGKIIPPGSHELLNLARPFIMRLFGRKPALTQQQKNS